jgi:hypothetical protein
VPAGHMPGPGSKTCHDAPCTLGAAALAPAVQPPLYCSSSVSNAWMSAVFNKYPSKPAARHASRMTSSPYAVRAIKYGRPDESASRSRRARIAQSGWKILAIESAVRPSAAAARTPRQKDQQRVEMSPQLGHLALLTLCRRRCGGPAAHPSWKFALVEAAGAGQADSG